MLLLRRSALLALALSPLACPSATWTEERGRALGLLGTGRGRSILVVLTSHDRFGALERRTGYWQSELTHFWNVAHDVGYTLEFASPKGGEPPVDPGSLSSDAATQSMARDTETTERLRKTMRLADVDPNRFSAVYFPGGHGPLWDLTHEPHVARVVRGVMSFGGVVSAVCHGPTALLNVTRPDGGYLLEGRKVTGFSNREESLSGLASSVPFLLEDEIVRRGGLYVRGPAFTSFVAVSGRLITGQNPTSTTGVAIETMRALAAARAG